MKKLLAILCVAAMLLAGCQNTPAPAEHTHTLIHNEAKAPTCINNGIKEHWYCPECNGRFADEAATEEVTFADLEVEELGHTGGTATCTEQAICERCGQPHGDAKGHTWDDAEATAKNCTVCGIHVNADFAGGKGTAEEPYLIKNVQQLLNITNFYDSYKYYKVADGVSEIDMAGQGKILLNGSFDGNGVKLVNLNTALFQQVGYQNTVADIKISNLDVTMNAIDGCALVRNIFNAGKTTFENVALHGYVEGLYNMGSFYNYGTANCDGIGANYTVEFINATSDMTLVCTSGNGIGGMIGHGYEGAGNQITIIRDDKSVYTGTMYTTNGSNGDSLMYMASNGSKFILNGVETSGYDKSFDYPSTKIASAKPEAGEDGYKVAAVDGAAYYVVYLNAQVTAYDEEGYKVPNKAGMTWPLGNVKLTEGLDGKVFDLITSATIVNGTDHEYGYELADGKLTIYSGRSASYESGNVRLQVNQYNADGELLATGTLDVFVIEHDHTFVGGDCTTDAVCNCGTKQKAPGHAWKDATCTAAKTCSTCGATEGEALGHKDENGDYKCDACSTKVLPEDGTALTIPQALAIAKLHSHNTYTTQKYYITGIINEVYNTQYGNMYIEDADGNEICIYGLYSYDGKTRYDAMSYKPVAGDEITVYTVLGAYNTTYQGKNAWLDEVVAHEHDYKAVVTEPGCLTEGYTTHTCSICQASYVDSKVAALGHTTEEGVCDNCGLTIGGDAPVVGTLAEFTFGSNGSAAHVDGSDLGTSKSYTAGTYTLSLTGMSKVYGPAYDAKGNSCIKLGTSSKTGTVTFTVPENVTEVVIYVAGYKAATSTNVKVNGTQTTVKTASNNGEYTAITIDTTTTKTITFTTVTYRCMIDKIVFNGVVA